MIKQKTLITIGNTAYTEGKWLLEAWNTIQQQSSDRWEAVMVLDGKRDRKKYFESIRHPKLKKHSYTSNKGV